MNLLTRWPAPLPDLAGSLMLGGGLLAAFFQDVSVTGTLPEQAGSSLVTGVIQALTVGGGLAVAGSFVLRRVDKTMDARDAQRQEEREHERNREAARDALFIEQLRTCQSEKAEERRYSAELVEHFFSSHGCTPNLPTPPPS